MFQLTALLCLFSVSVHAADPLWDQGLTSLQEGKSADAVSAFEQWMANAGEAGRRSRAAHHNLALAYSHFSDWGPTVYHLATAAILGWPWELWARASDLSRIQHHLLIQNPVSHDWRFLLRPFARPASLWVCLAVGFWLFFFGVLWRKRVWCGFATVPLLLAAAVHWGAPAFPRYAVVLEAPGISLKESPEGKVLVDLKPGALVALGETRGAYVYLTAPFAGWAEERYLKPLEF